MNVTNLNVQTVPPIDDPDRAPDVLFLADGVARTLRALGDVIAYGDRDRDFFERIRDEEIASRIDPTSLVFCLAFLLDELTCRLVPSEDIDDPRAHLRNEFIEEIAEGTLEVFDPVPGWYSSPARIDLDGIRSGDPRAIESMVALQLAVLGDDVWLEPNCEPGAEPGVGPSIAHVVGLGVDAGITLSLGDLDLNSLEDAADPDFADDGEAIFVKPTAADIASAAVMQWALEFMDATIPGLSRSFIEHALRERIPRGDLTALITAPTDDNH